MYSLLKVEIARHRDHVKMIKGSLFPRCRGSDEEARAGTHLWEGRFQMGLNIFSLLSTPLTSADLGWTGLAVFPPRSSEWVEPQRSWMAGGTPLGVWHRLLLAAGAASGCVASSNTRFACLPSGVPSRRSCSAPVLFVEKQLLHHGNCHISRPLASCRLVIRFPCAAGRGCSEPSWAQCPALISGVLGLPWGPGCPGDTIHRPTARSCSLQASPDLSRCQWVMGGDVFRACIASVALLVNRGVGDSGCRALHPTSPFSRQLFTCLEAM